MLKNIKEKASYNYIFFVSNDPHARDMSYNWHICGEAGVTAIAVVAKHSRGHIASVISDMCGC